MSDPSETMDELTLQKPDFRREHRLGLVVYGGVSLAIYMNGICQELYNCVRGRGIYKLLKALTDSDVVIDIISGTSAGGINGVLLSYALANSQTDQVIDFKDFSAVWRDSASIEKLMYQPQPEEASISSILDGAGYYQTELATALEKATNNQREAPVGEWLSEFNELDLFVTGTDILGRVYQVFDDTGGVIEVKDHRSIFHLKHRQGRKEPFKPNHDPADPNRTEKQTYQSLAKLCRITSCFPLAFPVVKVGLKEDADELDQRLIQWGQLENRELPDQRPKEGYQLYFMDGGVLDNRPFSYTIKEIYYRTANRPVVRKLVYIDPSPDRFSGSPKFQEMPKPNVVEVIQDALIEIPIYESIGKDLEFITEHNEKMGRSQTLLSDIESPTPSTTGISNQINVNESIYLRSRLISLRDRLLPLILSMDDGDNTNLGKKKQAILDATAQLLIEGITGIRDGNEQQQILQTASRQITNLDVDYTLRKHFYIIDKVFKLIDQEADVLEYNKLRLLISRLNRHIKLLEVIRASLEILLSHPQVSQSFYTLLNDTPDQDHPEFRNYLRNQIYDRLLRLQRFCLDADGLEDFIPQESEADKLEAVPADIFKQLPLQAERLTLEFDPLQAPQIDWLSQKQISSIFQQLKTKIGKLDENPSALANIWIDPRFSDSEDENSSADFLTVLNYVDIASEQLIQGTQLRDGTNILMRFQSFRNVDQVLFPFDYLTSLTEKDLIHTSRISPDDAQLGLGKGKTIDEKLAGDSLAAFGGFLKKSWRANDILWGRLDGLNRLFETLVTRDALNYFPGFVERESQNHGCSKDEYLELLIQDCLADAEPSDREKIKSHLHMLANGNVQIHDATLTMILNDLVLVGQRSILKTDLQTVIQDEIVEQLAWNQQRVEPTDPDDVERLLAKLGDEPPKYKPIPGYFQKSVSTLAATKLAKDAIDDLSPQEKEEFFRNQYRVGKETVSKDIPGIVLTNLGTRLILVIRDIIITAFGERRARIIKGLISYQFFNKSIQLFYWWLQLKSPLVLQSANFIGRRPLILIVQVLLLLTAIISVIITVSNSPKAVAIALTATLLFWLLGYTWKKD